MEDGVVEGLEAAVAGGYGADLALPDAEDTPAKGLQLGFCADVSGYVVVDLVLPEINIGFWETEVFAAFVAVPEASVDKDDRLVFRQDDIGIAGKFTHLHTKTQATGEEIPADNHLRLGILPFDRRHTATPLFGCHRIGHSSVFYQCYTHCNNRTLQFENCIYAHEDGRHPKTPTTFEVACGS